MSAIATKIIKKYNLSSKMSVTNLSQYTLEFLKNLADNRKRNQTRRCLREGFKFTIEGSCRIVVTKPLKSSEEKIIREIAKQILQNRYSFSEGQVDDLFFIQENVQPKSKTTHKYWDIRAKAYALALSAKNANASSSRLSQLQRELKSLGALSAIKKAKANCIDYPDHFTLELVRERLDGYDVSTLPDLQALADVIVMLCIRPAELTTLCITDTGVTGYAKNWDKPGVKWFNRFLKNYDLIPKYLRKIGTIYGVVAHKAKNMVHTYTIAGQCLQHSPDNHTSLVQNYVIVNYRKKVPITAILDSGANCNIIAEEIVNELDLKIDNISDVAIYTSIGKLDVVGGPKWKQVKVTNIFAISIPEHVLILENSWFKDNTMKVDFPNKTLTLLNGTDIHYLEMAQLNIFNLPELLEQILYFLEIDRSLYPTLFVSHLWYKCGILLLWRRVELK
ncbi:21665_t:CDS:2, partial [Gigaspora margarita]